MEHGRDSSCLWATQHSSTLPSTILGAEGELQHRSSISYCEASLSKFLQL